MVDLGDQLRQATTCRIALLGRTRDGTGQTETTVLGLQFRQFLVRTQDLLALTLISLPQTTILLTQLIIPHEKNS